VRITDAPGGGTRVEVEFPMVDAAAPTPPDAPAAGDRDVPLATAAAART
jgi:hypothetical protein